MVRNPTQYGDGGSQYTADGHEDFTELDLGDDDLFAIPSLSDFPATKSDASIVSKVETEEKKAKRGTGTLASIRQGIDTMPDSGYIHQYLFNGEWYKNIRSIFLVSDRTTIRRLAYRTPVSVFIERSRHLASYPNVIHPYSAFRWYWDILMTLFLMVTLATDPIRMTFYAKSLLEGSTTHVQIGILIATMYFLDIIFNFRTGLIDHDTKCVNLDPEIIAKTYILGWFTVDLLSSIPFDLIFILYTASREGSVQDQHTYGQIVRILELFKVFRLSRAVRYVSRLLLVRYALKFMVGFCD